jgi:hypothetical protein
MRAREAKSNVVDETTQHEIRPTTPRKEKIAIELGSF